jgi:tRNA A-37 threonylcarbamoyl transferase component Bud32
VTEEHSQQTTRSPTGSRVIAGRYVFLGEIGRGGMGVVWRAEDRMIGRHVAIKELRLPDSAEDAGVFQERVLREVRSGGRLNDPAVVTVYDVLTEGETTYIVMELVDAPTLSDLVRREGPLPSWQVAAIGGQVLSALQAAHAAGIVHRDVKPGNIMVAPNGRVKLTDFGIAQAVDDPRLTTSGMLVGSPAFMAPERVAGREAVAASDLWSLGATLFFAVEAIVAFERSSTAATLHAIMNEVPYLTHAQGPLASAIMGMLITNPDARISAEQAGRLLGLAAGHTAQSTPPAGQPAPQSVPTAMYPRPTPTVVAGHPPPATPATGATTSRGRRTALVVACALLGAGLLVGGLFLGRWWGTPPVDEALRPTVTYGKDGFLRSIEAPSPDYASVNPCMVGQIKQGRVISDDSQPDCSEQHDFEVYDRFAAVGLGQSMSSSEADLAAYPGAQRLARMAEARCALGFHSNVVIPADKAVTLSYQAIVPSQAQWSARPAEDERPTRDVYCVVMNRNPDEPLRSRITRVVN